MRFTIKRTHLLSEGTFGIVDCDNKPFGLTLELPWNNNEQNVSCIPTGMYRCKRIVSPKFGATFEVLNVPNRTNVLIHKANTIADLHGCIGVGSYFGDLNGMLAILDSGKTFSKLFLMLNGIDEFDLLITQC